MTFAPGSGRSPLPWWKQAVDFVGCLVGLPLLAMSTVIFSIVARYASPGPIIYRQERIGYMGRRFWIYKFRTMPVCTDRPAQPNAITDVAHTDEPLKTSAGRCRAEQMPWAWLLRSSAVDELPQLINVLRGEMSLVGPRPSTPEEFSNYVRWQRQRCDTLPGLTGLEQVSHLEGSNSENRLRRDLQYVGKTSFWLDLKIVLLTVPRLLARIRQSHQARKSLTGSAIRNEVDQPRGIASQAGVSPSCS